MNLKAYGLVGVVLSLSYAYSQYDKATNYVETTARVTKVEESCYLKKKERGIGTKTTITTKTGPCKIANALKEHHPEFKSYSVIKNTYVEFSYKSPVDGRRHNGRHEQAKHKNGQPIKRGDALAILAHMEVPEKTTKR
jgi:hypothetical protein